MAVFSFDLDELEGLAPISAQEQYLKKFGFTPPPLPEGYSHQSKLEDTRMTPPPSPGRTPAAPQSQDLGFGAASNGGEHVNKLVAKRKTQKRVPPTFVGSLGGSIPSAGAGPSAVPSAATTSPGRTTGRSFHEIAGIVPTRSPASSAFLPPMESASAFGSKRSTSEEAGLELTYPDDLDMNTDVPISSLDTNGRGKRKSSVMDAIDDRPSKARTLGGDRPRDTIAVRELAPAANTVVIYDAATSSTSQNLLARLPLAPLLTYLKTTVEGSEDVLEARNSEDGCGSLL